MSDDENDEQDIESVHRDILKLRTRLETMADGVEVDDFTPGRRGVMKIGGAAIVGAGAMAVYGGTAAADDGSEGGNIGSAANPALKVFVDTFHWHERSSQPSNPDDGSEVYIPSA